MYLEAGVLDIFFRKSPVYSWKEKKPKIFLTETFPKAFGHSIYIGHFPETKIALVQKATRPVSTQKERGGF